MSKTKLRDVPFVFELEMTSYCFFVFVVFGL